MAVAFVSDSVVAEHSTANTVYTAPTGIADGDLLIIWQFLFDTAIGRNFTSGDATPPTGFNPVPVVTWPQTTVTGGSNYFGQFAYYKIAASESGNYTVTHNAFVAARGIMVCCSGNDTTTPFNPTVTQNEGGSTGTTTFTGLSTAVANQLVLIFASDDNDTSNTLTAPTGSTPTFTGQVVAPGGETFCYGTLASAGATGNPTMTNNSSAGGAFSFFSSMMAIQPPTGGGGDLNIYRIN